MRIMFRDPTNSRNLCVAKIDSAENDRATNLLTLYGSFKGRYVLFRIPNSGLKAENLFNNNKLSLCGVNAYTSKITVDTSTQLVIDFYKEETDFEDKETDFEDEEE